MTNAREALLAICATLCWLGVTAHVLGQTGPAGPSDGPQVGQPGKDIVWLPTPQALVDRMLDLARVTPADHVIDLGSGDGRMVIAAAARGASALGIEYDAGLVQQSISSARAAGVAERARFVQADLFESDFSQATVITMFLGADINLRLRDRLLGLGPGTRIVSNTFDMGEWEADEALEASYLCDSWCRAFLWVVPARVQGQWELPVGRLTLEQTFQMVTGTITLEGASASITRGRLLGDRLMFSAGVIRFTGRVDGDAIEGIYESEGTRGQWMATRVAD